MTSKEILADGYYTHAEDNSTRRAMIEAAEEAIGAKKLGRVPGFYRQDGKSRLHLAGASGALGIPVRDTGGHIIAMQLRVQTTEEKIYTWLSSNNKGDGRGTSPGTPCHVPLHTSKTPTEKVRLTEGAVKANIATRETGVLTLGIGGVALWRSALPVLKELGVKKVLLAWDQDAVSKPQVAATLYEVASALRAEGYEVAVETWPSRWKGIDDALVASKGGTTAIQTHEGADALDLIQQLVRASGAIVSLPRRVISLDQPEEKVIEQTILSIADHPEVFLMGGGMVQAHARTGHEINIEPISSAVLRIIVGDCARYVRGADAEEVKPPPNVVAALPDWRQLDALRRLRGVIGRPILRDDGSVRTASGYDPSTELYLRLAPSAEFVMPKSISLKKVKRAVRRLKCLVGDFPFKSEADRSCWLAALLTACCRHLIQGPAPMFVINGNVPGSGKTLLVNLIGCIAEGHPVKTMPPLSGRDDEDRKRITTIAREGQSIVLLDNVAESLGSPSLDAALTSEGSWTDRQLGTNRTISVPLSALWFATGNNIGIKGDLSRRCVLCRLETDQERPELRTGFRHPRLLEYTRKNRGKLLRSVFTILGGYLQTGRPKQDLPAFGSYDAWSRIPRSAIVWAGEPDPCRTRNDLRISADPVTTALPVILRGLYRLAKAQGGQFTAVDVHELWKIDIAQPSDQRVHGELWPALDDLLPNRVAGSGVPNVKQLGVLFRKFKDRPAGGRRLKLRQQRGRGIGNQWVVEKLPSNDTSTKDHKSSEDSETSN